MRWGGARDQVGSWGQGFFWGLRRFGGVGMMAAMGYSSRRRGDEGEEGEPGGRDIFAPPPIPVEVRCLHCEETFDSNLIHWVPDTRTDAALEGFWCCPTPGCDGKGFLFDIYPTDPEYRDEDGNLVWIEDEEDEEAGDLELGGADEEPGAGRMVGEDWPE
jgi:hypothetical protein